MKRWCTVAIASAAVLLELLPEAVAHGHGHNSQSAGADENMTAEVPSEPAQMDPTSFSYFRHPEHGKVVLAHIALMTIGWAFVLPVAVMLSVARSRWHSLAQLLFLLVNALGLVFGVIYNHSTPDLYKSNKHHPIGWVITWIAFVWVVLSVVTAYTKKTKHKRKSSGTPISHAAMAMFRRFHDLPMPDERRWSGDSGQGTERNSSSLFASSRTNSTGSDHQALAQEQSHHDGEDDEDGARDFEKQSFLRRSPVDRFLSRNVSHLSSFKRTIQGIGMAKTVLDRMMLLFGFLGLVTGAIVYGAIMKGPSVFNGLAHFIKGGIFFWYGFLTLGRWMGCFADFGWAWNRKPPKEIVGRWCAAMPSAEFFESATLAFYGVSNVGLEHLANPGGEWAAIDLEHVSITLMFFGGGLLGMLIESTTIRDLLQSTIQLKEHEHSTRATLSPKEPFERPEQWRFSMNPMPALIITLLGIIMSSHHQASAVSTKLHTQWGNLFAGFGLSRIATYAILYLRSPISYLPQRPPTEVIASFCLMAGGIMFMLSNKDTVAALEYNGLDAMFVFNVVMGLNAFIMAWGAVCLAVKGFAQKREFARAARSQA